MNSLLHEILGCRHYLLQQSVFGGFRSNVFSFLNTRETEDVKREAGLQSFARFVSGKLDTTTKLTDFRTSDEWEEDGATSAPADDVKRIHLLRLTGPMTRGGGACSYGSIEMRDQLMEAADRDDVIAHIIYCRTPGGMATTLLDFRKAIDYIHERGQKIYMFCDGTVASGGAFLSAMCDGVYAYNENDEIGSIGMYTAFFTMENGAVNAITQEKYVEFYADKSTEKNRAYRDGADLEFLAKETNEYLDELLADMKRDRPSIKEEQMNGAMFKMKDVVGSIIDGICSLPELCERVYAEWASSLPTQTSNGNPNNLNNMNKDYNQVALAAGYEAGQLMTSDNQGILSLQPHEADAVEEKLSALTSQVETLAEENTQLKKSTDLMTTALANMALERDAALREVSELKEAASKNDDTMIQEAKAEMQAQIDEAASRYAALEDSKKELENSFAELATIHNNLEAKATADAESYAKNLAAKEQIISDLQAQLAEAQSGIGAKVVAGESPKSNGEAPGASQMTSAPAWDSTKTPAENVKIFNDYMASQKNRVK